jgi:hypothetical protein
MLFLVMVVFKKVSLLKPFLLLGKFFFLCTFILITNPNKKKHSHWKLGKLIALYDDNAITIDGSTEVSFTEDVIQRFEAYGWHTVIVGDGDNDLVSIEKAIEEAKAVTDKPTLIKVKTTIGML